VIIIQDTREKEPWLLTAFSEVHSQVIATVNAGDYTIKGKEKLITIDRKKKPAELANNLGMYKDRFMRELERMKEYQHRYVVCEFPYEKLVMFPKGSGLPLRVQRKVRAKGKFLVKQVERMSEEYEVEFIFCANREEAQEKAIELFKRALEGENKQDSSELPAYY
jgi:hypothetical protein